MIPLDVDLQLTCTLSTLTMVLKAGYPGTSGFRKVVKVTVMVKKKEGLSDADFIDHYNNKHAQMAAPVLLKHEIISYSLVRSISL